MEPCRLFIFFCLAILLAFCLLFSAMRQLLSDIEKLGCGCHTKAPKPICVSCVCRGAEARTVIIYKKVFRKMKKNATYCQILFRTVHNTECDAVLWMYSVVTNTSWQKFGLKRAREILFVFHLLALICQNILTRNKEITRSTLTRITRFVLYRTSTSFHFLKS